MKNGARTLLGTTEVAMDNISPHWHQEFTVDYNFQDVETFDVEVRHKKDKIAVSEAAVHKTVGTFSFTNVSLMMSTGQKMMHRLRGGGAVIVRGESVKDTRDIFKSHIMCDRLARKNGLGIFGKSDPYVQITRQFPDGTFVVVYKTVHQLNNLKPIWKYREIPVMKLCNGDFDAQLKVEVLDYDPNGTHVHMGEVLTTLNEILKGKTLELMERGRKKGFLYQNSGTIRFANAEIERHPSLAQFIMGGMQISLNVAIDFTASNGEPQQPKSLHRAPSNGMPPNDYEQAITSVGGIIEGYNREKKFAVYGFGARLTGADGMETPTQHCFPVYGGDSTVNGVAGIIQAYRDALNTVKLSGPTHFQPLLQNAGYLAQSSGCTQDNQNYTVLLILTDGIVDDMDGTIAEIVKASALPLSVIIVGIGNEDFSDMNKLDGENSKEKDDGTGALMHGDLKSHRDIVQFVHFKKWSKKGPMALAQHVLADVPKQIISYCEEHQILPNEPAPPPADDDAEAPAMPAVGGDAPPDYA
jgi:hypothetical protein